MKTRRQLFCPKCARPTRASEGDRCPIHNLRGMPRTHDAGSSERRASEAAARALEDKRTARFLERIDRDARRHSHGHPVELTPAESAMADVALQRGMELHTNWPRFLMSSPAREKPLVADILELPLGEPTQRIYELLEQLGVTVHVARPDRPGALMPWRQAVEINA